MLWFTLLAENIQLVHCGASCFTFQLFQFCWHAFLSLSGFFMHSKVLIYAGDMYSQLLSMSLPLSEYVKLITKTMTVSPPGYPNHRRLVLTDDIKRLMRRVLALMPDPETNNICFFKLKANNVFVDLLSGKPFLHAASWTANYDVNLARMNYARVGEMFRQTIFSGAVASLPADFQQLLSLMKTNGDTASYAIQHHCSLIWRVDKKELFTRIYDFSNDILQKWNYMSYTDIMNSLHFPANWDTLIQQNPYLNMLYRGSTYYPNAGKEILRFKRNAYIHCLQHAWDMGTMQKIYDQADMGEMLETALSLVLHSFQLELDKRGLLRHIRLESLFL
jgi:hypothetical protein